MEGNIRPVAAPESPDLAFTDRRQNQLMTRYCSDASSLTQEIFKDEFHHNVNVLNTLDDFTVWTDEKHNSYLDHLEASFIKQLHRSIGLLAQISENNLEDASSSQEQPVDNSDVSQEFTLVSNGCCQKMTFDRTQPSMKIAADPGIDIKSPCLQNYRSFCNCCAVISVNHRECSTVHGKNTQSRGKRSYPSVTSLEQNFVSKQCEKNSGGNVAEVSDQNFSDEDQEEKINSSSIKKRKKTALANTSVQDQTVPPGKVCLGNISWH